MFRAVDNHGGISTVTRTVTIDTIGPSVAVNQAAGQADPTNTGPVNFTVVFSEPVTGFTASDVSITGTAPGTKTATVTGSGTTYDVAVSGMTGSGMVTVTVPAGGAADAAGNLNAVSTSTDDTVTYDVTAPTVAVNQAAGQADPTNTGPVNFTVVFSEAVTGFTSSDVSITGTAAGTKSATVTGSGTTYDVAVSGMTGSGTVIATVPAGGAADTAGNANAASTSTDNTVTFDNGSPTVTANQAATQEDPTDEAAIDFTVVFSDAVTGFTSADVAITGSAPGTKTATVTGSGTTYNVAVSGMTASGTVILSVPAGVPPTPPATPTWRPPLPTTPSPTTTWRRRSAPSAPLPAATRWWPTSTRPCCAPPWPPATSPPPSMVTRVPSRPSLAPGPPTPPSS